MKRRRRIVSLEAKVEGKSSVRGPRGAKEPRSTVFYVPTDVKHPLYLARLTEVEQFLAILRAFLVEQRFPNPADFDAKRARWTKKLYDEIEPALKPIFDARLRGKRGRSPKVAARIAEIDRLEHEERVFRKAESITSQGSLAAAVKKAASRRGEKVSTARRSYYPRTKTKR